MLSNLFNIRSLGFSVSGHSQPPSWKWIVLSLASCLFILSQFYRVSNAIIAIELQKDLSLDAEKLGL
ncbi:MAG: hypothetical protein ABII06_22335, partial [Pseudomonadota bacterium]